MKNQNKAKKKTIPTTHMQDMRYYYFMTALCGIMFLLCIWVLYEMLTNSGSSDYLFVFAVILLTGYGTWKYYQKISNSFAVRVYICGDKIYINIKYKGKEEIKEFKISDIKDYGVMKIYDWNYDQTFEAYKKGRGTLREVGYIEIEKAGEYGTASVEYIGLYSGKEGFVKRNLQKAKDIIEG